MSRNFGTSSHESNNQQEKDKVKVMKSFGLLFVFGLFLILGPFAASAFGMQIGGLASAIMIIFGIGLVIVTGILSIVFNLYKRPLASEAFVRTGMGGEKVISGGGALVFPVVHQMVRVPLSTHRLQVHREGVDALITKDKLRADVLAEFFIRILNEDDAIKSAARSLGSCLDDPDEIAKQMEDKLVSALRTVAAGQTLEELNSERDTFVKQVSEAVKADLEHNGFTLEVVTISRLDQTDPRTLRDNNIFDAQGLRTIALITQTQLTERNRLEREGEQARTAQNVETKKRILALEQDKAQAEAEQAKAIAIVTAETGREATEKKIGAEKAIRLAQIDQDRALKVAEVEREQATTIAERDREAAVAGAEAKRAVAQATQSEAEAKAEAARQNIQTVTVTSEAEREKKRRVIEAEAAAETTYVARAKEADANAYGVQKSAEGKKLAADAEAEATTKKAEAEAVAAEARARGTKAEQMVPIEVKRAEVEVDQKRVNEVLVPELQARKEHGDAAQKFELQKLEIEAEKSVRIATANAIATISSKVTATVVGTPEQVSDMVMGYVRGMSAGRTASGFTDGLDPKVMAAAREVLGPVAGLLETTIQKLGTEKTSVPTPPTA